MAVEQETAVSGQLRGQTYYFWPVGGVEQRTGRESLAQRATWPGQSGTSGPRSVGRSKFNLRFRTAIRVHHNNGRTPGNAAERSRIAARIHRIEGQVRGLAKMIENDGYCLDILTQINAVKGATNQLGLRLLEAHLKRGLAVADGVNVGGLMLAVDRFSRS